MTNHRMTIGQGEVAFSVEGAGRTSVLLHGFTGNKETMADLGERLGGRRVCPDLPGHGDTTFPEADPAYSMDGHIDLLAALVEARGEGPIDLIGYSMGARVALSFALRRPKRVRTLTLVGGSPGIASPAEQKLRVVADTKLAHKLHSEGIEAFVDHWMSLPMWHSLEQALGPDGWQASRDQRILNDPRGLAESLIGIGTGQMPALHDRLDELTMPVLLVVGELDEKFRAIAGDMAKSIPNAKLKVAGGAGHAVHLERPDATAAVIEAFIGER